MHKKLTQNFQIKLLMFEIVIPLNAIQLNS